MKQQLGTQAGGSLTFQVPGPLRLTHTQSLLQLTQAHPRHPHPDIPYMGASDPPMVPDAETKLTLPEDLAVLQKKRL